MNGNAENASYDEYGLFKMEYENIGITKKVQKKNFGKRSAKIGNKIAMDS